MLAVTVLRNLSFEYDVNCMCNKNILHDSVELIVLCKCLPHLSDLISFDIWILQLPHNENFNLHFILGCGNKGVKIVVQNFNTLEFSFENEMRFLRCQIIYLSLFVVY